MFDIRSMQDLFYSDACLIFVVTGVICAVVRWFHMCHPYDRQETTSYPARRQMTLFYGATILQFPYILAPSDPDVWIYIRSFCILYYPLFLTCVLDRYFNRRSMRATRWSTAYAVVPFCYLFFLMLLAVCDRPLLCRLERPLLAVSIAGSLALTCRLVLVMYKIKWQIDAFHEQNFSNEHDFPLRFAERVMSLPFAWLLCMWAVFVTGSRDLKFFFDLTLSAVMVLFLCIILHPQRLEKTRAAESRSAGMSPDDTAPPTSEEEEENGVYTGEETTENADDRYRRMHSDDYLQIREEVLHIVQRRYLESGLKRSDVIADVQYGKHTQAGLYITDIGFYRLVNSFRLAHARLYAAAHPNLSKDAIAEASGFRDRFGLHNAQKKIGCPDAEVFADFLPTSLP